MKDLTLDRAEFCHVPHGKLMVDLFHDGKHLATMIGNRITVIPTRGGNCYSIYYGDENTGFFTAKECVERK